VSWNTQRCDLRRKSRSFTIYSSIPRMIPRRWNRTRTSSWLMRERLPKTSESSTKTATLAVLSSCAFRCAGDRAQSEFFLLHSDGTGYVADPLADAATGRLEILETNPAEIRIWSAEVDHDACVWCEQRYRVSVYAWEGAKFVLKSKKVTSKKYLPIERTQHPIVRTAMPASSRS